MNFLFVCVRSKRFLKAVTYKKRNLVPKNVQLLWFHEKSLSIPHHAKARTFIGVVYYGLKSLVANMQNWQVLDSILTRVRAETVEAPLKPTVCDVGAAFSFTYEAFSGTTISTSHGVASLICGEMGSFAEGGRRKQLRERGRLWEGPCVTRVMQPGRGEGWAEELGVTAYVGWTGQRQLCLAQTKPGLPPSL